MTLKEKWCKALEDGKYKQGIGYLRGIDNKFCPLGVLADLVTPNWTPGLYSYCFNSGPTPYERLLEDRVGLSSSTFEVIINMNDKRGKTFKEIATYIRTTK